MSLSVHGVYYNASTVIYHNEIFFILTHYTAAASEKKKRERNGKRQKHDNVDDMPKAVASKQKEYLVTII